MPNAFLAEFSNRVAGIINGKWERQGDYDSNAAKKTFRLNA